MAKVSQIETPSTAPQKRSDVYFPSRDLADSLAVAKTLYGKGGGKATGDALAVYLGYKSTHNGAYLARIGAARGFGLIVKSGDTLALSARAQQILMPTYPEQAHQGLVEAFLSIELFKRVYEDFKGKELPPDFGMKNALRNTYKVVPTRIDLALKVLKDSAEDAGFFAASKNHLIMPQLQVAPPVSSPQTSDLPDESEKDRSGGGGNDGGGGGSNNGPVQRKPETAMSAIKVRYIESLIQVFEEKAKQGDLDETLMSRIEKMLEGQ